MSARKGLRFAARTLGQKRQTSASPAERLHSLLRGKEGEATAWRKAWLDGTTPWDAGSSPPVLADLVRSGSLPRGRALVPGCGSGYDAITLAQRDGGDKVVGLDIVPEAVAQAQSLLQRAEDAGAVRGGSVSFVCDDFFCSEAFGSNFDLIFDYTFLCALSPTMRAQWARRMVELLAPGGQLVCVLFPVDAAANPTVGPPYPLDPPTVQELCEKVGLRTVELSKVQDSIGPRRGREWLGRWERPPAKL